MWADIDPQKMWPSMVVDARSENAPKLTSKNVIHSSDAAKIRKDAEDAIRKDAEVWYQRGLLKEEKPLGGGGIPISHTDKTVPGSNRLSTPNGSPNGKGSEISATDQENSKKARTIIALG